MEHSMLVNLILEDVDDVGELCSMLELTPEDVLEAFPEACERNAYKFVLPPIDDGVLED
jgi:hypothetical protein